MKISMHIVWLLPLLLVNSGCFGTVAPKTAKSKQASYSSTPDPTGSYQTSGVWGWRTNHFLVIDDVGRDTYNTLILRGLGTTLTPPVAETDLGITAYTNDPTELLNAGRGKIVPPVKNPGNLFQMNPVAQQAWPAMTELSRAPVTKPP